MTKGEKLMMFLISFPVTHLNVLSQILASLCVEFAFAISGYYQSK